MSPRADAGPDRRQGFAGKAQTAKKSKICPARVTSPMASGSVLPSSRASSSPSSCLRSRISSLAFLRIACRSRVGERDQAGNAVLAASIALSASSALALAYSPTTSFVLEGLMFAERIACDPFASDHIPVQHRVFRSMNAEISVPEVSSLSSCRHRPSQRCSLIPYGKMLPLGWCQLQTCRRQFPVWLLPLD